MQNKIVIVNYKKKKKKKTKTNTNRILKCNKTSDKIHTEKKNQ